MSYVLAIELLGPALPNLDVRRNRIVQPLCPNCHRPILDERDSCPYCGSLLARTRPDDPDESPDSFASPISMSPEEADYSDEIAAGPSWSGPRAVLPRWPYYVFALYLVLIA